MSGWILERVVAILREEFNCGRLLAQDVADRLDAEGLLADDD